MTIKTLDGAPRQTLLRMSDLANGKNGRGLVGLTACTIYRKIQKGMFPKPHKYPDSRAVFWTYGEILDWMEKQAEQSKEAGL